MIKNLIKGFGSILNIFPPRKKKTFYFPILTDEEAIRKDWEMVGFDIREAVKKLS